MLSDPLQAHCLVDSGAAVTNPFAITEISPGVVERRNLSAAYDVPEVLRTQHSKVGKGANVRTRVNQKLTSFGSTDSVKDVSKPSSIAITYDIREDASAGAQLILFQQALGMAIGTSNEVAYDHDISTNMARVVGGEG
jgi:hypothetical protein